MKYDINFSVKYPLKESGTGLNFRQKENGRNMNMHICTHMSALKESGKLTLIREATKKKVKKFHNKCELSPKMENLPPPPISQQF